MMTDLTHLSDDELLQYHSLFSTMVAGSRRAERVKCQGADMKFLYHLVRLLNEVEQILTEGDLDLQRNNEQLKAIRRGDWTLEQVETYFADKERQLEEVYNKSELPWGPDEQAIKQLLLDCLEQHYGSLQGAFDVAVVRQDESGRVLADIVEVLRKHNVVI
jgi:hypothetical protein